MGDIESKGNSDMENEFENLRKNKSEKDKKNIRVIIVNIIIFSLIITLSCGIFLSYPAIKNMVKKDYSESPYEDYAFLRTIYESSYVLNKKVIENESGQTKNWGDIYLDPGQESLEHYAKVRNSLYKELDHFERDLENEFKNLEYEVLKSNNKVLTNSQNDLKALIKNGDSESLKYIQDKYAFYVVIRYDEQGYGNVESVYGGDSYKIRNILSEFKLGEYYSSRHDYYNYDEFNSITINSIKNITFIYAIPKDLVYTDTIAEIVNSPIYNIEFNKFVSLTLYILVAILAIGLCIPYKFGKNIIGVKLVKKLSIEINCILFIILAYICACTSIFLIKETFTQGICNIPLHLFGVDIELSGGQVSFVNILGWMCIIYVIFLGDMLLKHILNVGIVKYIKEKSLVIKIIKIINRVLKKIINKLRTTYEEIAALDLKDKHNKYLIKGLVLNFIAIAGCCIFWIFGIIVGIIYSLCIFYVLKKRYEKLKNDFKIIVSAAEAMSDGNLDMNIEEDLGMFNPLKDNLEKIQIGFKKAVDEEVKSQKMKTELISNVSHDLKTPLTSIITYVDLLKKDDVSEGDRKSYIDTLDKKSQRLKFLIEDLFEVSKATSGNVNLNLVNVDIIELIKQVEIELDDKFKRSDLIIKNNFPENKIMLKLDSQKTFRIFENLLSNVSKYSMSKSRVYIDIKEDEDKVEITIKNMSAIEMNFTPEEIVERFQRGDKSRNTEGSGLGLAIVKSFVELQCGKFIIEVDGDLFKAIVRFKK